MLRYDTPDGAKEVRARSVALTVPAYVTSELVRRDCPNAANRLDEIDYPPVAAVSLAYPKSAILTDRLDANGDLPGACRQSDSVSMIRKTQKVRSVHVCQSWQIQTTCLPSPSSR